MADNIQVNLPTTLGKIVSTTEAADGSQHENIISEYVDGGGEPVKVSAITPMPVTDALAEAALTTIAAEDFATHAAQIDNSQKTQLVDAAGNPVTVTGNKLDVNAVFSGDIEIGAVELKNGTDDTRAIVTPANALKVDGSAVTQPVSGTFFQGTQPVSAAALPLPSGAATSANQQTDALTNTELRASPVPISGTVAVTGTGDATAANQVIGNASLSVLDDWDESDRAKVNLIVGQAGIAAGTGVDGVTVPRVTLATNVALPAGTALIGKVGIDQTTDGTTNKVRATATQKPSIGATAVLAVTALQSLASSATVGWGSVRVSNLTTLATDYEIFVKLTTANTAPGSDKCMYVFCCPFYTTDAGSTWFASSQGTTTLPTGTDAASTIASPHNLRLLGVLNYTTQQMVVQDTFLLSNCFGNRLPDGFSIIIINFSGAALSTGCVVDYSPINDILV